MSNIGQTVKAPELIPDREMLGRFTDLMFKHADRNGVVSLRAFPDEKANGKKPAAIFVDGIRLNDPDFLNVVVERARQAATWDKPAVYCPPMSLFKNHQNASAANLIQGPCLSVECDQKPSAARVRLEALLGAATIIVESGGEWTNPETGEVEPKLHLHWRLKKPTATEAEHGLLREARELATALVGGDTTNIPLVHPIRWPGSWHRKGEPRLATITAASDNAEIDLDAALKVLREAFDAVSEASGTAAFVSAGVKSTGKLRAADDAYVVSALAVIPNGNDSDWNYWNNIGMKTWAATGGSEAGRKAFHQWSSKSAKYDSVETDARWDHYVTSPPTQAGFGSLVYLARRHAPRWTFGTVVSVVQLNQSSGNSGSNSSGGSLTAPPNSEEFLALVFVDRHETDLRFVAKWSQWLHWDELRWQHEDTLHAFDMARAICREAAIACNKTSIAKTLASAKTVTAVERLAKADRKIAATFEQWDTMAKQLNTSEED
ncbi:PriCT-2 domain-containing protein [Bradyrhizobium sp. 604_D8_N2_3]|uniref:PriCT-2 domain-containing protein n=1 Tax=Bradyrhizobium sp. 604_D8_N2_3 TaxID=3240370 RepID=UPI003F1F7A43